MLKVLKYIVIAWALLSIVTFPFYWPWLRMVWVFNPSIPKPKYETPINPTEARLQDIDYLSTLTKYDRAFNEEATAAFAEKVEEMREAAADMSEAEFYLAVAEAVALADNGHSNVSYRPQYTQFNTIGARLYAFDNEVYIVSAAPDKADALGARVLAVNGLPIKTLRTELGQFKGGNQTWRELYGLFLIESPELLEAAGYSSSFERIELTLEAATGDIRQVPFEGLDLDEDADVASRSAWQSLVPNEGSPGFADWPHVLGDGEGRLLDYLTDTSEPKTYSLTNNGLYIRALPGFRAGDQSIKNAYKSILSEHPDGSLDYMVVDFRLHDGGDYTKSMSFAKAAPRAVKDDGKIYIITGPNTFSAAIVTVAMLKYYSGDRAMIVGEQMGDREQFWAERGTSFRLPNSGYYINYATGYHDWENGCKGEEYCYTMNEMYEVPAGSLKPEISLPQDFSSYLAGEDVVLNWISDQH
ncbi:MAG: hypothetical protein AAF296_09125 [Pseudomonadota bacterium]